MVECIKIKTNDMTLLLIGIIVFGISFSLLQRYDENVLLLVIAIVSGIYLLCLAIAFTDRISQRGDLREIEAFKQTILEARKTGDPIERAAFLQKIAEWNEK